MRLDKFLQLSGLAKRRSVAKKLCDAGRVKVGDRVAKAATDVKVGEVLELRYGERGLVVVVRSVSAGPLSRSERRNMYEVKREIRYA